MKIEVTPAMIEAACQARYKKWPAHNAKPEARAAMRYILEAALATPLRLKADPDRIADAWQELCDRDDRTSPAEYPGMCLITRDELEGFMHQAYAGHNTASRLERKFDDRETA